MNEGFSFGLSARNWTRWNTGQHVKAGHDSTRGVWKGSQRVRSKSLGDTTHAEAHHCLVECQLAFLGVVAACATGAAWCWCWRRRWKAGPECSYQHVWFDRPSTAFVDVFDLSCFRCRLPLAGRGKRRIICQLRWPAGRKIEEGRWGAVSRRLDGPRAGVVARASLSPHAISAAKWPQRCDDDAPLISPRLFNHSTSVAQHGRANGYGEVVSDQCVF